MIYRVIKKNVNTLIRIPLWYNFKLSPYVHHPINTFLESSTGEKKNVNISIGISSLEKQNWYYGDHLGKVKIML